MNFNFPTRGIVLAFVGAAAIAACATDEDDMESLPERTCGNRILDDGEACEVIGPQFAAGAHDCRSATDGLLTVGTISCKACTVDTSACRAEGGTGGTGATGSGGGGGLGGGAGGRAGRGGGGMGG